MVVASSRRRRSLARRRLLLLAAVAALAGLAYYLIFVAGGRPAAEVRAESFAAAWGRSDYAAMHAALTDAARQARPLADFTSDYKSAASTATATAFVPGTAGKLEDGVVSVPMTVRTRAVGTL